MPIGRQECIAAEIFSDSCHVITPLGVVEPTVDEFATTPFYYLSPISQTIIPLNCQKPARPEGGYKPRRLFQTAKDLL